MSDHRIKTQHEAHKHKQAGKRGLLLSFIIFMAWVVGIGLLLSLIACQPVNAKLIASDDTSGYYIDLSKNVSGQASRKILAFFVSVIDVDSQSLSKHTDTAPPTHTSVPRGQYLISMAAPQCLPTDYDGLTLQNKIAIRRICKAVTNVTESKTRHPILLLYSVAFTQKTLGSSYMANSIRTTSNTTTPTTNPVTFDIGDAVLCALLIPRLFLLIRYGYGNQVSQ